MANAFRDTVVKRLDHVFDDIYYEDINDCTMSMTSITITSALEKQGFSEQCQQIEPGLLFRPEYLAPPYSSASRS